jgi:hypothetical protein
VSPRPKSRSTIRRETLLKGRLAERAAIADYIEANAVLMSGHVRKPWIRLAEEIRRGSHHDDRPTQATAKGEK